MNPTNKQTQPKKLGTTFNKETCYVARTARARDQAQSADCRTGYGITGFDVSRSQCRRVQGSARESDYAGDYPGHGRPEWPGRSDLLRRLLGMRYPADHPGMREPQQLCER